MRANNIKKYLPVTISVGAFIALFVVFVSQNSPDEVEVQLSPRHSSYFEKFGESNLYAEPYVSWNAELKNVRVNSMPGASEPRIISNPTKPGTFAVVTNDFSAQGMASIFLTNDNGAEWKQSYIPLSLFKTNDGYYSDPWADYDSKGNLAFVTVAMRSEIYSRKIILNISGDDGKSWMQDPVVIKSLDDPAIKLDKPKVKFDKDNVMYIVWLEEGAPEAKVFMSISRDGGKTFENQVKAAEGEIEYADVLFDGGRVYIVYSDERGEIKLTSTDNNGAIWSEPVIMAEYSEYDDVLNKQRVIKSEYNKGVRVNSDPQAVISNGKVLLTYAGMSIDGGEYSEVYIVEGDLASMEFSEPKAINEISGTDRFLPAIVQDKDGGIHIIYYTSQNDPENILTEVHLASTYNHGTTFTFKNISTENFNPYDIVVDGSYMGDYISLAVNDGKLIGVWTDGRNEMMDVIAGIVEVN